MSKHVSHDVQMIVSQQQISIETKHSTHWHDLLFYLSFYSGSKSLTGHTRITSINSQSCFSNTGFGAFVDKTLLPYTDTNELKLQRPCTDKNEACQPAFGFEHVLSLTGDGNTFRKMVAKQNISGNLDPPEGSLDAIMQAAVCMVRACFITFIAIFILFTFLKEDAF